MSESLRLMAVHAHPDDESSKGAATMARYVQEGAQVLVVTMTGGERGDILNPAMERPEIRENIAEVRREEMNRAREILGIEQEFAGFVDSGLPEGDPLPPLPEGCFATLPVEEAAAPLVAAIRRFRPHVILTYDENGGYPHPDHIMTHKVSMHAFDAAPEPEAYPDAGEPWQPLKLYYFVGFPPERFDALAEVLAERGMENPFADWAERIKASDRRRWEITTRVHCSEYFDLAHDALRAHATQIDPNGFWFAVPNEIVSEAWPTEDYHLVRSLVDTEVPEKDLFAGVREAMGE
ncbi:mycothiol conjugate amidase Mca [Nocardiopsis alkaliphila]|uniref:mycothiol conjugate amidase Mca n=1 Tax=Nocardiopsis alkaliphila TaxID=225762 RepID=UPI00034963B0|nr:mycothiol conjugate amidase Mca [Nocardiopsis alkaliphila]